MSASYSAGVFLGVKLSEIGFNAELVSVPFQVHDKKGKPTGNIDYEKSWNVDFQGNIKICEYLYSDTIEEIINIQPPLFISDNRGYEDNDLDKIVIGVEIIELDYDYHSEVKELKPEEKFELVKAELKTQFGVDVEPKLYFYFQVS